MPSASRSSSGAVAPCSISSKQFSDAPASIIMMSTSPASFCRPATTSSNVDSSSWSYVGFITHWPSTYASRTQPTGPSNGISDTPSAAEAAFTPSTSTGFSPSTVQTVTTT